MQGMHAASLVRASCSSDIVVCSIKFDPTPGGYQIKDTSAGPNSPDIEVLWFPLLTGDLSGDPPKGHGFTVGAIVLKQEGSGSVTLKSSSIYDDPLIDHKCASF